MGEAPVRPGPLALGEGNSHLLKSYYVLGPVLGPFVYIISGVSNNPARSAFMIVLLVAMTKERLSSSPEAHD